MTALREEIDWAGDVPTGIGIPSAIGSASVVALAVVAGWWSVTAPIAGAVVAPGVVVAAAQNQHVQHLEGGIVDRVLVHEGDRVVAGQVLYSLDRTVAEATRDRLLRQSIALQARMERLVAERDGSAALAFSPELLAKASTGRAVRTLTEQAKEFVSRLDLLAREQAILRQRSASLREQIEGLKAQRSALDAQMAVVLDETRRKKGLLEQGLTDRSEYSALLRSAADLTGTTGSVDANILSTRTQIVESEEQYARLVTQRIETAASKLNDVMDEIASNEEQLRAAQDVLGRMEVRAPNDGVVVRMPYNAHGAVVRPGETMLDLLPTTDGVVVETRIRVDDVDVVSLGKDAKLRFSAYDSRTTPEVRAKVVYRSADRLVEPSTQQPYYLARLRYDGDLPLGFGHASIDPGMPVEVYVDAGSRTFAQYVGKPILDSFRRAFNEE